MYKLLIFLSTIIINLTLLAQSDTLINDSKVSIGDYFVNTKKSVIYLDYNDSIINEVKSKFITNKNESSEIISIFKTNDFEIGFNFKAKNKYKFYFRKKQKGLYSIISYKVKWYLKNGNYWTTIQTENHTQFKNPKKSKLIIDNQGFTSIIKIKNKNYLLHLEATRGHLRK